MSCDGTTILFSLPGVRVQRVERVAGAGRGGHLLTDDPTAAGCPECGVFSTRVCQRRITRPPDLPYGAEPLVLRWHKGQYACTESGCVRKAFTEPCAELPAWARLTGRRRRPVAGRVADGRSVAGAAGPRRSGPIAPAAFVARAAPALTDPPPVPVLGSDQTRRGRPVGRRGEDGTGRRSPRLETNVVDLAGGHGRLGQTAGRPAKTGTGWLDARGADGKDQVRIVARDPGASYRSAGQAALPPAVIVADHVPLVRLAHQAVTEVRRRVSWDSHGRRTRTTDPAGAARRRLLGGRERRSPTPVARAGERPRRRRADRADPPHRDRQRGTASAARHRPHRRAAAPHRPPPAPLLPRCAHPDVPELNRLATTLHAG